MIIVNLIGLCLIGLIIWWFWLYKPKAATPVFDDVVIEVKDGVYSPAIIQVMANRPFVLRFNRVDATPCAESVLIPALNISEQLLLNQVTQISFDGLAKGEYSFHCQMMMYQGVIKVI
ncbi:cupredoxin domain-containing protein [Thalassotalea sp. LPB0316]|uniref:cupredoxin domain-containing protein n=1 Tax=Thalassotalea sp. LPB0316 TaxID=2769490 RepID=UPI001865F90C|nr:cupredoxin domain-containing protein [Thalassotalea sp. LPB0316]QOL25645.1 cupredoxin domain-containing protein [Thalassotalea sp. LPB0316]